MGDRAFGLGLVEGVNLVDQVGLAGQTVQVGAVILGLVAEVLVQVVAVTLGQAVEVSQAV